MKKELLVFKQLPIIANILLFVFFSFVGCKNNDKLIGRWVRYGDVLSGMKIEITNIGGSFKAEIIEMPDSLTFSGFYVGDVKWKDIKKLQDNKYEYLDLKKTYVTSSMPPRFKSENGEASLVLIGDTIIKTRIFAKGDEFYGAETSWKRIK